MLSIKKMLSDLAKHVKEHTHESLVKDGEAFVLHDGVDIQMNGRGNSYKPYYSAGDTITCIISSTAGFLTDSKTSVRFTVPLDKPVLGSPTVTVSTASGRGLILRQSSSYTHGSSSSVYVTPSSYSAWVKECGVEVWAVCSTTTNAVNNDSIGVYFGLKIVFS